MARMHQAFDRINGRVIDLNSEWYMKSGVIGEWLSSTVSPYTAYIPYTPLSPTLIANKTLREYSLREELYNVSMQLAHFLKTKSFDRLLLLVSHNNSVEKSSETDIAPSCSTPIPTPNPTPTPITTSIQYFPPTTADISVDGSGIDSGSKRKRKRRIFFGLF